MTLSPAPRRAVGLAALSVALLLTGCNSGTPTGLASPLPGSASSSPSATPSRTPTASTSASPSASSGTATAAAPAPHWAYEGGAGPDHWGELASAFSTCGSGEDQSPIDLPSSAEPGKDDLLLAYAPVDEEAVDTGHTLQLDAGAGAQLTYNGDQYTLQQLHYHDPSEHTVDGSHAPVEVHLVNRDTDGNLLVIGVLAVVGQDNPSFAPLVAAASAGGSPAPATVDVASMMPSSLRHFAYTGSLTTPPCSEGVQWLVMEAPVEMSQEQIDTLTGLYEGNSRPVQPLNGREVHLDEG